MLDSSPYVCFANIRILHIIARLNEIFLSRTTGFIQREAIVSLKCRLNVRPEDQSSEDTHSVFFTAYLFCRTVQLGLNKLLLNIILVEGRPSLESDLNIVAAILAIRQALANDVGDFSSLWFFRSRLLLVSEVCLPPVGLR